MCTTGSEQAWENLKQTFRVKVDFSIETGVYSRSKANDKILLAINPDRSVCTCARINDPEIIDYADLGLINDEGYVLWNDDSAVKYIGEGAYGNSAAEYVNTLFSTISLTDGERILRSTFVKKDMCTSGYIDWTPVQDLYVPSDVTSDDVCGCKAS